jgi:hypothetical protein
MSGDEITVEVGADTMTLVLDRPENDLSHGTDDLGHAV